MKRERERERDRENVLKWNLIFDYKKFSFILIKFLEKKKIKQEHVQKDTEFNYTIPTNTHQDKAFHSYVHTTHINK